MVMRRHEWVVLLALLLCWGEALAAVTAQVDRYNISVDETINLTIEVSGDDSGEPDTSVLQGDFEILSRNQSSSYSLINGSMSSKSTWFLMLRPRHAGTLTIPAFKLGNTATTAINIQVSKSPVRSSTSSAANSAPQSDLWIDMSIEPKSVRVQQQAIITIRIFQASALSQAQLSSPTSNSAMIMRLGDDKTYQTVRDGRNWAVTERRFAIFPQQHGMLKIEPVQLDGSIMFARSIYNSPFQSTKPVRVRSNALQLAVDTIPVTWPATTWLPAKQVQILEDWPSSEFKVGDSITRTLTLRADALNASQLPELSTMLPEHLKGYSDKPVLTDTKQANGIHSIRQDKLAILATRPGTFTLPAIAIVWWNSATESIQTSTLPARTFKVLAAPVEISQSAQTDKQPINVDQQGSDPTATWWKWLALIASTGWLLTLAWLFFKSRGTKTTQPQANINVSDLKKAVLQACQQQQAKACEQALLSFSAAQWPHANIHNLATLANYCDAPLVHDIKNLERHLYGNQGNEAWQAEHLQLTFEQCDFTMSTNIPTSKKQLLPSLYPTQ